MTEATIRIVGHHLPGRVVGAHRQVHLGIQRGREVVDLAPADCARVEFVVPVDVRTDPGGSPDFYGPFAHGRRGARFIYLNWVDIPDGDEPGAVGRVKLVLSGLPANVTDALSDGSVVRADLDLTDARGRPVYASVKPPEAEWTVESPADAGSSVSG